MADPDREVDNIAGVRQQVHQYWYEAIMEQLGPEIRHHQAELETGRSADALRRVGGATSRGEGNPPRIPCSRYKEDPKELAARGGYTATNVEVITEDGYSLWMHRIGNNNGPPVLFQHGIFVTSESWILRGRKKDLGTTVFLAMTSSRPEYNSKVRAAVLLSPVAFPPTLEEMSPLFQMLLKNANVIYRGLVLMAQHYFVLRTPDRIKSLKLLCGEQSAMQTLCMDLLGIFAGEHKSNLDKSIKRLSDSLPNVIFSKPVPDPLFTHLDMLLGLNSGRVLYPDIINLFKSLWFTR
ncbi:unnamed protein product [Nezara viridula]|uniref:Partial AB-hydrolase lipase domain-containing protein n=1 Tax=Nezara viridula TaxID=85310 RepID=A0A9P0MI46_NEZVI|nr:unnamed protein product [Nezara viridula]